MGQVTGRTRSPQRAQGAGTSAALADRTSLCATREAKGRVTIAAEVDHLLQLAKGGADNETNFQSLCEPCHRIKTAQDTGRRVAEPPRRIGLDGYPIPGGK